MTKPLFAFGTLLDADVLQQVCAEPMHDVHLQPAVLPGFIQRYVRNETFPALVQDASFEAHGALIHGLNHSMLQRIKIYESDEHYELENLTVFVDGGTEQDCQYFKILASIDITDRTWDLQEWQTLYKGEWMQMLRSI
jgi:hypothetical protein